MQSSGVIAIVGEAKLYELICAHSIWRNVAVTQTRGA